MEGWVELKSSSCATKVEEGNNSCVLLKDMWKTQESSDNARSKCYHQNLFQKEDPALLNYSLDRLGRDTIACPLFKDRLRSQTSHLYHVNLLCSCWQLSVTLHFVFSEDSRHLGPGNCKSKSAKKKFSHVRHSNSCPRACQQKKILPTLQPNLAKKTNKKKQTRSHTMKAWPQVNSLLLPSKRPILCTLMTVKDINKHLPCLEAPRFARGLEHFLSVLRLFSQSVLR